MALASRHSHEPPPPATEPRPTAIALHEVSKFFGGSRDRLCALDNVSFSLEAGCFVSLIGPSGCGKSTLLQLVAGIDTPTTGTIEVKGMSPLQARRKREFGIVFQQPVLFDWRTVDANVALPLQIMGYPRAQIAQRVEHLLELVGLERFARHHPWQLSGGMQQRVAIARALTFQPSFLLMDEPFGALDLMTRDRMGDELLRIWADTPGTTVLFITHSIPEAVLLSDRVIILSERPGRILEEVQVDLPRPRDGAIRQSEAFFRLESEIRQILTATEQGPA
jgi:NitT/TauT family transport system ATP-binding protein